MFNDALEILNAECKTHLEKYPPEPNPWLRQSWGSEDCRRLVAEQVASLLEQVQDEGVIRYPSFSFTDNVEYVQGYGLRYFNNANFIAKFEIEKKYFNFFVERYKMHRTWRNSD